MSFYANDPRPDETTPSAHHDLSPVEIGVIVGTVTAFFALVITVFLYRNRKAQRLQAQRFRDDERGEFPQDHKDNPHSYDGEPLELVLPAAPKPAKHNGILPVPQIFYKRGLFRKASRANSELPTSNPRRVEYMASN